MEYQVDGHLAGTPVVADGNVYVGTNEGQVYALRADSGSLLWSHSVSNSLFISPAVNRQIVYIASEKNNSSKPSVYSLQAANGAVLWQTQLPSAVSFPATLEAETVYISTQNGCAALRAADGSILWQHSRDKRDIIRSPLIVLDGVAYTSFSTQRHDNSPLQPKPIKETYICALRTSDGSLLWQRRIEGGNTEIGEPTIPAIDHDAIYIGAGDGILRALRLDGTSLLWYQKTGGNMLSAPVVAGEVVYAGANDGCVYAFQSSDGNLLWKTFVSTSLTVNASVRLSVQQ